MKRQLSTIANQEMEATLSPEQTALFETISLLQTAEEVKEFFQDLFTPKEIGQAAKRWCAARSLFDGRTQAIAKAQCTTSKALITRARREIVESPRTISRTMHKRLSQSYPILTNMASAATKRKPRT